MDCDCSLSILTELNASASHLFSVRQKQSTNTQTPQTDTVPVLQEASYFADERL